MPIRPPPFMRAKALHAVGCIVVWHSAKLCIHVYAHIHTTYQQVTACIVDVKSVHMHACAQACAGRRDLLAHAVAAYALLSACAKPLHEYAAQALGTRGKAEAACGCVGWLQAGHGEQVATVCMCKGFA